MSITWDLAAAVLLAPTKPPIPHLTSLTEAHSVQALPAPSFTLQNIVSPTPHSGLDQSVSVAPQKAAEQANTTTSEPPRLGG